MAARVRWQCLFAFAHLRLRACARARACLSARVRVCDFVVAPVAHSSRQEPRVRPFFFPSKAMSTSPWACTLVGYSSARRSESGWLACGSQCLDAQAGTLRTGAAADLPALVKAAWDAGEAVVSVAHGAGRWVLATVRAPQRYGAQAFFANADWNACAQFIKTQWGKAMVVTELTFAMGAFVVVTSQMTGAGWAQQTLLSAPDFDHIGPFIQQHWTQERSITSLATTPSGYICVMTIAQDILPGQRLRSVASRDEAVAFVSNLDDDQSLTVLAAAPGGGYLLVASYLCDVLADRQVPHASQSAELLSEWADGLVALNQAKGEGVGAAAFEGPAARMFSRIDTNNDGVLSLDELKQFVAEDWASGAAAGNTTALFASMDLNEDGKITRDEWLAGFAMFVEAQSQASTLAAGAEQEATKAAGQAVEAAGSMDPSAAAIGNEMEEGQEAALASTATPLTSGELLAQISRQQREFSSVLQQDAAARRAKLEERRKQRREARAKEAAQA